MISMTNVDPELYKKLDAATLTSTLLNPDVGEEVHRAALTAFSLRGPAERNKPLVDVLGAILKNPTRWHPDIPEAIIDLFATDPSPQATHAMLEILTVMLEKDIGLGTTGGLSTVRNYFYTALAARDRDTDIEVWSEFIPRLDTGMLVSMILDPQAEPLVVAIDPYELLNRTPEPGRTNAIFSVILGATRAGAISDQVRQVWDLLRQGAHRQAYQDGIEALIDHWERANQSGRTNHAAGLEAVLAVMDKRPRSTADKLTGKRPWAS